MPFPAIGGLNNQQGYVSGSIARAASRTGVDFDYLMAQAGVESSFNPTAKASTSSASGLFQFTDQTWLSMVSRHGSKYGMDWAANAVRQGSDGSYRVTDPGLRSRIMNLRFDPEASSMMAGEFAAENRAHLRSRLGWEPESVDLYLAHFLGAGGANKFLSTWSSNPDASAAPLFPKAARANRSIFYGKGGAPRSLDEIRTMFDRKLASAAGNTGGYAAATRSGGMGMDIGLGLAALDPMNGMNAMAGMNAMGEMDPLLAMNAMNPMTGSLGQSAYPTVTPAPRMVGDQNSFSTPTRGGRGVEPQDNYRPLQMQEIVPMPNRLSVDFARSVYERFSGSEIG